jgi:putative ATPase
MEPQTYYTPQERGFERKIAERIAYWNRLRGERGQDG